MKVDWGKVWQEFEKELDEYLRAGNPNDWQVQQEIIERVVGRNLTPVAADEPSAIPGCRCFVSIESYNRCPVHGTAHR